MNISELNKRIKALKGRNLKIVDDVQELGLSCLTHCEHGNTDPLNGLVDALTRSQVTAFAQWALAYGKVKKNSTENIKLGKFFAYDKARNTDIEGATAKVWDTFAVEKDKAVEKAFDVQAVVMRVMKQAAEAGKPQSIINALGAAVGIEPAKVPKSKAAMAKAEPALV